MSLRDWVLSQPEVVGVRQNAPDWIVVKSRDGREGTIGCCWPDEPCGKHKVADSVRTEKFKKGIREFLDAK